ncbi:hypothetical protein [Tissierella creatinophila]|uniref:Uncharacterized protein n=1 Tax=Tissierella creatinophila DSM 6911 TaxID=1123403 RepID=A0A1U7M6G0_TISCR|nr:hypothetical protein [Tissierella creatinophila]OLS02865.1 hypothetical protein TICRE_11380 [Tissierella creatinophila DSM 6911]
MKKKMLVNLIIIAGISVIYGGITYADALKDGLEMYLQDPKLDFLGRNYDKMFFELLEGEDPTIIDKIKAIPNDFITIPLQAKCNWKMATQKTNALTYGSMGYLNGLKTALGTKEFNKIIIYLFKLASSIK